MNRYSVSENKKEERIKTGISQVFWCEFGKEYECEENNCETRKKARCDGFLSKIEFEPAAIKVEGQKDPDFVSWVDELLDGGILIPQKNSPMTMLITGPPGSGKTTFSLELCYRLAKNHYADNSSPRKTLNPDPIFPLYISADTETAPLKKNAESFGWSESGRHLIQFTGDNLDEINQLLKYSGDDTSGIVALWGKEKIKDWKPSKVVDLALQTISSRICRLEPDAINKMLKEISKEKVFKIKDFRPNVLVIDSLNILESSKEQAAFFNRFLKTANKKGGIKLNIVVLDSTSDKEVHRYWEYVSDIVIRLDKEITKEKYVTRSLEIVKARFQRHVLGKHYFKILPKFKKPLMSGICNHNIMRQRCHPYREEGGIFLYPSIHYYLSLCRKNTAPSPAERMKKYPKEIADIVQLPRGRCTTFRGNRGTHKSHLAYTLLLHSIIENKDRGLIVTLREDEKKTERILQNILLQLQGQEGWEKRTGFDNKLRTYTEKNYLEILHYLPGCITPNEFFHRLFVSVQRLKAREKEKNKNLFVIFNSLDQLSPRYPLCVQESMFIPGIIEFLLGAGITVIFIAADKSGQPVEEYGLLPMSDLILSFKRRYFVGGQYYEYFSKSKRFRDDPLFGKRVETLSSLSSYRYETVLEIEKCAGGVNAGRKGILELVEKSQDSCYDKEGLYFTEINFWDNNYCLKENNQM